MTALFICCKMLQHQAYLKTRQGLFSKLRRYSKSSWRHYTLHTSCSKECRQYVETRSTWTVTALL